MKFDGTSYGFLEVPWNLMKLNMHSWKLYDITLNLAEGIRNYVKSDEIIRTYMKSDES